MQTIDELRPARDRRRAQPAYRV